MPIITEEIKQLVEPVVTQANEVVETVSPYLSWSDKSEIMVVMAIVAGLWLFSKITAYALKIFAGLFLLAGTAAIIFN